MNLIHALILGVVEGLTEFLPISSTGHLILTARLLEIQQTEFMKTFDIAIQSGAIMSVVVLYWKRLLMDREVIKRVAAAFLPTAVIGGVFYKLIKKTLLGSDEVVLWSLLIGGIFMIVFERMHKEKTAALDDISQVSLGRAALVGVCQSVAMIPGVSRAAATIIGGLAMGMSRRMIVEFSFLLAVPTMLAATAIDVLKSPRVFSLDQGLFFLTGFVSAFVIGVVSIRFFLVYIQKHSFIPFGIYRIVVALFLFQVFS
jgi:undecaprenyl-diphosphatase